VVFPVWPAFDGFVLATRTWWVGAADPGVVQFVGVVVAMAEYDRKIWCGQWLAVLHKTGEGVFAQLAGVEDGVFVGGLYDKVVADGAAHVALDVQLGFANGCVSKRFFDQFQQIRLLGDVRSSLRMNEININGDIIPCLTYWMFHNSPFFFL